MGSVAHANEPAPLPGSAPACDLSNRVDPGASWRDRSNHRCGYVHVNGLRIHYLDWGGKGPALVFLPGIGASAHVFDDFATRFTGRFRVLAITPPNQGESGTPDSSFTVDDAASAVFGVLDSLGIRQACFAAHSFSGATITRMAARHPERVAKLVYLDALTDLGPNLPSLPRPAQPEGGFKSAADRRDWMRRSWGMWNDALEADMWANNVNPAEAERRRMAQAVLVADATSHPKEYAAVSNPALGIWTLKSVALQCPWVDRADASEWSKMNEGLERRRVAEQKGVDRFRREMKRGRIVSFEGTHGMFITNPERTMREMMTFLLAPASAHEQKPEDLTHGR